MTRRTVRPIRCPWCAGIYYGTLHFRRHLADCTAYRGGPSTRSGNGAPMKMTKQALVRHLADSHGARFGAMAKYTLEELHDEFHRGATTEAEALSRAAARLHAQAERG